MRMPKTVFICAKCSDCCFVEITDASGKVLAKRSGYVPDFMPGEHWGDYVELEIDIKTGKIRNWKPGVGVDEFVQGCIDNPDARR